MSESEPRIQPLPALIFNGQLAGRLADLIAPPYDLIDKTLQQRLYARSPYNVVRLELSRDADPYASAAATLARWTSEGVVHRVKPALFLYTQAFELNGQKFTRNGLVARVRLEEFASGRILPHEQTFPKAKEDRLRLLMATRANISSVFGLYPSGNKDLERLIAHVLNRPPLLEATDDQGMSNEVRAIDSSEEIAAVQRAMEQARILIADGHHRYETALQYRRQADASPRVHGYRPEDYVMMTLVAFDDPGLVILPTHRVIHELGSDHVHAYAARVHEKFTFEEFDDPETMLLQLRSRGRGHIGAALKNRPFSILSLRSEDYAARALAQANEEVRKLDVAVLHALILDEILGITPQAVRSGKNVSYTIDARAAASAVSSGRVAGAFLLNPPTVYDVEKVSNAGATMPEKSTYFYPKLQTGLLMNSLE